MAAEVVEAIAGKLFSRMASDAAPRIVWHGGEPTTAPIAWYRYAYERLSAAAPQGAVFAIQTNAVAISEAWIEFLKDSKTEIGISIDGPETFHDARRKTRTGTNTWAIVMKNFTKVQSAGLRPTVISVLQPESLSAADEFYAFYRDNNIDHVSFSIDETYGVHPTSSFDGIDYKPALTSFLTRMLSLAFSERYPLHVREIERIAAILTGKAVSYNEQVHPWDVIALAANGDITTFSPDFMELRSGRYNNFCFGNILQDDFDDVLKSLALKAAFHDIKAGVELCEKQCRYFQVCQGGSPGNKMSEHNSLESAETLYCRLSVQAPADALIEFVRQIAHEPPLKWSELA